MALCAVRLAVDLPRYGMDAVRDSSIWYYGIYAFVVAAAAIAEPTFVPRLLRWYRRVLPWYFAWAPVAMALTEVDALASVYVPGTSTPINVFRYTDVAVHIAMGLGFLWLGVDRMVNPRPARNRDALVSVVGLIALLVVGSQTRGGFLGRIGDDGGGGRLPAVRPAAADRLVGGRRPAGRAHARPDAEPADRGGSA